MAPLNYDARAHKPTSHDVTLPAPYSQLSTAQRRAAREQYVVLQKGACLYCKSSLEGQPPAHVLAMKINWHAFPGKDRGFLRYPVHLHHDHGTDLTLGAVHAYCNAVLWQHHKE